MSALADDCFRFVTGYFEIIKTSAPHIYHSALASAPQESLIRKLYQSHDRPLTRVIHGLPTSWDTNTATAIRTSEIKRAVWSPCNRFIAISYGMAVDVLDSATLHQLQTLEFPWNTPEECKGFVFSPDSSILTCSSGVPSDELSVVSWDLQTGGIASAIRWEWRPQTGRQRPNTDVVESSSVA